MNKAVALKRLTGFSLLLLLSGCTSLDRGDAVPLSGDPNSQALAEYGMAVRSGMEGNADDVVRHYRAAADEDLSNTAIRTELALILLQQGNFDATAAVADEILVLDPRNIKALQIKALGLRVAGKNEQALSTLERAAAINPDDARLHVDVAGMMVHRKDTAGAIRYLENKAESLSDPEDIYEALGEIYAAESRGMQATNHPLPPAYLENMLAAGRAYPENASIQLLCGEMLILNGRLNDGLACFDRAANDEIDPAVIRRKIGASIAAISDRSKAIAYVEKAVEENPADQRLSIYLSELYEMESMTDESIRVLDQAASQPAADGEIYIRLIRACLGEEQAEKALDYAVAGVNRFPEDHRLYELQGYICLQLKKYGESAAAFSKAETLFSSSKFAPLLKPFYLHSARANQRAGDIEKAAELLRKGREHDAEIIEQFIMSNMQYDLEPGQFESALEVLDKISDLIPREPGPYAMFGLLAMRAENYAASLSMLEQAKELAVEAGEEEETLDAQFYFLLGSAAERNRHYDKAEEYFLEAIRLQPDHADAHNYIAYMNAERGAKLEAAMDHIAVALAIEPDNPAYLDTRGWIYYQLGNYTSALADVSRAFERMPDDSTITDHLADIYMKLGEPDQAARYWQMALDQDPSNTNISFKIDLLGSHSTDAKPAAPAEVEANEERVPKVEPIPSGPAH